MPLASPANAPPRVASVLHGAAASQTETAEISGKVSQDAATRRCASSPFENSPKYMERLPKWMVAEEGLEPRHADYDSAGALRKLANLSSHVASVLHALSRSDPRAPMPPMVHRLADRRTGCFRVRTDE